MHRLLQSSTSLQLIPYCFILIHHSLEILSSVLSKLSLSFQSHYRNTRISKCFFLSLLSSFNFYLSFSQNLLHSIVFLQYLLAVYQLLKIIMTSDSFDFRLDNDIVLYNFFHSYIRFVLAVIFRTNNLHVWLVFIELTILLIEVSSGTHVKKRMCTLI